MTDAVFTDDESTRLDAWYEADKPGTPWDWIGITEDAYNAKRATARARVEAFLKMPAVEAWLSRIDADWRAEQARWVDDGGAVAPDDHPFANSGD